jgi:hypothetical protein
MTAFDRDYHSVKGLKIPVHRTSNNQRMAIGFRSE